LGVLPQEDFGCVVGRGAAKGLAVGALLGETEVGDTHVHVRAMIHQHEVLRLAREQRKEIDEREVLRLARERRA
jgi:hypothetical protein